MPPAAAMSRSLRVSGILVLIGLLIEALCLVWSRPLAFVVLVSISGGLIGLGVLFFLHSLLPAAPHSPGSSALPPENH